MTNWEKVWEFYTARFCVALEVAPETMDPEGCFATGDDELDAENVALCREGGWNWFVARVSVIYTGVDGAHEVELGADILGGCSYRDLEEFKRGGYFRSMVSEAIAHARREVAYLAHIGDGLRQTIAPTLRGC